MQYTIAQPDLNDLIGVMQSITARLNSFLRQTNNNLYVIIAVEKATGPPVWGVPDIFNEIYNKDMKMFKYLQICNSYNLLTLFIQFTYNVTIFIYKVQHKH
jgi:hypothetical protein